MSLLAAYSWFLAATIGIIVEKRNRETVSSGVFGDQFPVASERTRTRFWCRWIDLAARKK